MLCKNRMPLTIRIVTFNNSRYFIANQDKDSDSLHLWRVSTSSTIPSISCITCELQGPQCSYNKIHVNSDKDMFIQECLGLGVPFTRVVNLQTLGEVLRLDDNDKLND